MEKARIMAFLFLIILVSQVVFASSYQIELSQYENNILEKHRLILDKTEKLEIELPQDIASLNVKQNYTLENNRLRIEGKSIEFSFVNKESVEKGQRYYLTRKIKAPTNISILDLKLELDEGFLAREVYPSAKDIESDGQKIILIWQFRNISKEESIPIFIIMDNVKESLAWLWLIIVAALAISVIWLWLKKRKEIIVKARAIPKQKKVRVKEVEKYLLENERKVMQEISKEKEIWQKQLQIRTGLSKVKLSRVLKNLERRGLIKKISFGKTNKIALKK